MRARDSKAWTHIFRHSLTVPQYNVRFGMFFNERWGVEVAHDHIKWIVRQDQQVRMTGTLNGATVDTQVTLTPDFLRYQLNNGANPLFVNLIRRVRLRGEPGRTGSVSFLAKAGGGSRTLIQKTPCSTSRTKRAFSSSRAGTWTPWLPSASTS